MVHSIRQHESVVNPDFNSLPLLEEVCGLVVNPLKAAIYKIPGLLHSPVSFLLNTLPVKHTFPPPPSFCCTLLFQTDLIPSSLGKLVDDS